jgi:hypothetical protein
MRAALHAIGRPWEVHPLLALGAQLHEVESLEQAFSAVSELDRESALLLLAAEFAEAETRAATALVIVLPGARAGGRDALEMTRELVSRSVGVDLIAKSKRMVRRDG